MIKQCLDKKYDSQGMKASVSNDRYQKLKLSVISTDGDDG